MQLEQMVIMVSKFWTFLVSIRKDNCKLTKDHRGLRTVANSRDSFKGMMKDKCIF